MSSYTALVLALSAFCIYQMVGLIRDYRDFRNVNDREEFTMNHLTKYAEFMMLGAVAVQQDFTDPDEDWDCVALAYTERTEGIVVAAIDPDLLSDSNNAQLQSFADKLVADHSPDGLVVVTSAWMLASDARPSDALRNHPDTREVLTVYGTDRNGEEQMHVALILRDGEQPPVLGAWQTVPLWVFGQHPNPVGAAFHNAYEENA